MRSYLLLATLPLIPLRGITRRVTTLPLTTHPPMSLIRWQPFFSPFDDMGKAFEGMIPSIINGFTPAVDVYLDKDSVVVETPLAGVDPKDVEITIENDVLTVRGTMEHQSEVDEQNYYRKEIRSDSFYRTV